jgi:hypothetical protein
MMDGFYGRRVSTLLNPRVDHFYFILYNGEKVIGRIISKNAIDNSLAFNILDRTDNYDRFGNVELNMTEEVKTTQVALVLHQGHIIHNCSNECRITGQGENRVITHADDGRYILNSFSFTADHKGDPGYYIN